ncbi:MAG: 50S ribosomal protein L11 methyltransferase [Fimbriimonas sp.]
MSWLEVRATLPPVADTSPFVEIYREHGIENTLEEGDMLVGAIVEVNGSAERVEELATALREAGATDVQTQVLPEVNWEEAWKQFFKPRRIGKRFIIRPTWEPYETGPDDLEIVLDPGQAFGTGDHATTRLCLELLEQYPVAGKTVADVGCGSGILSIAAVQLGATVHAVDVEATAVEVSRENMERNGVSFRVIHGSGIRSLLEPTPDPEEGWEQDEHRLTGEVSADSGEELPATFDLVISNIISAILIRISADVAGGLVDGGAWIVSGIIPDNWPDVLAAAERAGFTLEERREEDGWVAARLRKG